MITQIEVELKYAPPDMTKAADIMECLDFGISGLFVKERLSFETTNNVDDGYIASLKKAVKSGFEKDGGKVYSVLAKVVC